jgi:ribosomal protein L40E
VDPTNDPDASNNKVSLTFTIGGGTSPAFDFTLTVSPGSVSVMQGGTAHYAVQVQYSDPSYSGTAINLQLTGLGPGMNWQVRQTGDLMITTTPASPTGTYTISLTGSANGVTHQTGATLIVTSQQPTTTVTTTTSGTPFDYSVVVSPSTQSVEIGGTTSYLVSVYPLTGSPVSVSLTLMGLPIDIQRSFTVQSGNPPYTSTLNLDLSTSSANAGAYTLTVVATAAGSAKTATAILMIKEKAVQTTVVQTTTGGLSSTTTIPPPGVGGDLTWIIVGILAVLIVIFAALALRRRQPAYQPTPPAQPTPPTAAEEPKPSSLYCAHCGTENPSTNEFCGKCGQKLLHPNL